MENIHYIHRICFFVCLMDNIHYIHRINVDGSKIDQNSGYSAHSSYFTLRPGKNGLFQSVACSWSCASVLEDMTDRRCVWTFQHVWSGRSAWVSVLFFNSIIYHDFILPDDPRDIPKTTGYDFVVVCPMPGIHLNSSFIKGIQFSRIQCYRI